MIAVLPIGVFTSIVTKNCAALETTVAPCAPDPSFTSKKTTIIETNYTKQKLNSKPYFVFIYIQPCRHNCLHYTREFHYTSRTTSFSNRNGRMGRRL